MKQIVNIEGMMCEHCAKHVEQALSAVENVEKVKVELKKKRAVVKGDVSAEAIKAAVPRGGL